MKIVKTRSGYAVAGDLPHYLVERRTKRECQEFIDFCAATKAELAQFEAEAAARVAALLDEHGIAPLDYRQLQPGDLFTWRPEVRPKIVTEARHFESGASLILWEPDRYTPPAWAMTLMTPSCQAYGRHTALVTEQIAITPETTP